jgi:hypothetical protein
VREYPAAVDIPHHDHRQVAEFGQTHVRDVAAPQIDLCR